MAGKGSTVRRWAAGVGACHARWGEAVWGRDFTGWYASLSYRNVCNAHLPARRRGAKGRSASAD
eukprot:6205245-Pleurochrysis_carterae.AAC.3